jgi:Ca2+-binding RTX toxin-like protein
MGSTLFIIGADTCDSLLVTSFGCKLDGSTGLLVVGLLNNKGILTAYTQTFTAIVVNGFGGNDLYVFAPTLTVPTTVTEGNGNDIVTLGGGTNVVNAGDGKDTVLLGDGNNTVTLGNGNDCVTAGNGDNTVTVGNGNDNILLGNGNNVVVEGNGTDFVAAGNGANLVVAGLGQHTIVLGNGDDILIDGSVTLTQSGDSLRSILTAWQGGASAASLRPRLSVTYNVSHPNFLLAGSGPDWFLYTSPKTISNIKPGDSRN